MTQNSTTRKAALWVGVVFLLGAALGGMIGYVFAHQKYVVTNASPTTEAARRAKNIEELTRLANLTPEQSKQADGIVADIQAEMKAIRKTTEPQIEEARQKGRARIRAIMTEEQKPKFEEFVRKLDEERKLRGQ
jgi:hypothetical protein